MFCAFCKHFTQPSPASPRIPARANGGASCAGPSRLLLLIDHRIKLTEVPQVGVGGAGPGHHPGQGLETQRVHTGWPAYLTCSPAQPGEARGTAPWQPQMPVIGNKKHANSSHQLSHRCLACNMSNIKQYWIHHCLATGRSDLEISFKALLGNQIWPPWSQTPHGSLQSHCAFMRCAFPVAQSTAHGTPNAGTPAYSTAMCLCVISAWTWEEEKIVMKMSLQAKQGCRSLWEPPLSQECTGFPALVAHTHVR